MLMRAQARIYSSSPTCAVSAGPSAAVGSSMMRMRALKWIARVGDRLALAAPLSPQDRSKALQ